MAPLADSPLIFISHRHADQQVADLLQTKINSTFMSLPRFFNASDSSSLEPGTEWFTAIVRALKDCKVLLAILSPGSLDSPWVNFESGAAWINDALIIPCCLGQVRKGNLPSPYRNLQGVNLDDAEDLAQLFAKLAEKCGLRLPEDLDFSGLAADIGSADSATAGPDRASFSAIGNRIEEHLEVSLTFSRSLINSEAWAAEYQHHARIHCLVDELEFISLELTPPIDALPFGGENTPTVKLAGQQPTRSSDGFFRLAPPYRNKGAAFACRLYFDPPLSKGDTAEYTIQIDFPSYKLAFRDSLVSALMAVDAPVRDYDYVSRTVVRACDRLIYQVRIPKELGAIPMRPEVLQFSQPFPAEQQFVATEPGVFTITEEDHEGTPVVRMTLDRARPPQRAVYRLRWRLPMS